VHGDEWTLSPDGLQAAYTGDYMKIHLLNIATGEDRQLTPDDQYASEPAWDPTGRYLLYKRHYESYQTPDSVVGLKVADLETDTERLLMHDGAPVRGNCAEWSLDGRSIVFSYGVYLGPPARETPTPMHVITVSTDGAVYKDLTPSDSRSNEHPHWSADGRQIIFESFDYDDRHLHDTRVVNADGTGYRRFAIDLALNQSLLSPDWRYRVYSQPDSSGQWGVLYAQMTDDACGARRRQMTTYLPIASVTRGTGTGHYTNPWGRAVANAK
jgi:Tol biopolymer transport system component